MWNMEWRTFAVVAACSLTGCVGDQSTAPTPRAPSVALGTVAISPANAIMAVGGTLQLSVTGQSLTGEPIAAFDSVQYLLQSAVDTLRVTLSPTGLVTAVAPSGQGRPVLINVIPFKDGIVKGDQSVIQVTATAVTGATLSIQPVAPDSAKLQQGARKTIVPVIKNPTTNERVANPTVRYRVSSGDIDKLGFYAPNFSTPTISSNRLFQFACQQCTSLNQTAAVTIERTAQIRAPALLARRGTE